MQFKDIHPKSQGLLQVIRAANVEFGIQNFQIMSLSLHLY